MKIDFTKIKVRPLLSQPETEQNVKDAVGDMVWNRATSGKMSALAVKIFNSDGDVEISDDELSLIERAYEGQPIYWLFEAIKNSAK